MRHSLSIVGCGNLGLVLSKLLVQSGFFQIDQVLNRSRASTEAAVMELGAGQGASTLDELRPVSYVMVAVPDQELQKVGAALAQHWPALPNTLVFHCSGSHSRACFEALAARGARTISLHPLKSFADKVRAVATFAGTYCAIEGELPPDDPLFQALLALRATPFSITAAAKPLYHAASVFGCNYLVALVELALQSLRAAHIPEHAARQMLRMAMEPVLTNSLTQGPAASLSGPIARGDVDVVQNHLTALATIGDLPVRCYQELGQVTLSLRQSREPKLSPVTADRLHTLLNQPFDSRHQ